MARARKMALMRSITRVESYQRGVAAHELFEHENLRSAMEDQLERAATKLLGQPSGIDAVNSCSSSRLRPRTLQTITRSA
jgi:hypothetical protein